MASVFMEYGTRTVMKSKNGYSLAVPPVWVRANKLNTRRKVVLDITDEVLTIRPAYFEEAENDAKN